MKKFLFRVVIFLAVVIIAVVLLLRLAPDTTRLDGFGVSGPAYTFMEEPLLDSQLDLVKEIGFGWYRVTLPWQQVQNAPGQYQWSFATGSTSWDFTKLLDGLESRNIDPLVVLDGGPIFLQHTYPSNPVDTTSLLASWEAYVTTVVDTFGGQVDAWEIGSEPNTYAYWGNLLYPGVDLASATPNMELYAKMLKIAHDIITAADANDVVVLGGLYFAPDNSCDTDPFGFLGDLKQLNAWDDFDVIGLHLFWGSVDPLQAANFNINHDPYTGACLPNSPITYSMAPAVKLVHDFAFQFGRKPIWVTSMGWSLPQLEQIAQANATSASKQESDLIVRSVIPLLSLEGVEKVFYYSLTGDPSQPEYVIGPFGMQTFANLTSQLTGSQELGLQEQTIATADVSEYRFQKNGVTYSILFRNKSSNTPAALVLSGTQGQQANAFALDAVGLTGITSQTLTADSSGNAVVLVGSRPVMVIISSGDPLESISLGVQDRVTVLKESVQSGFSNLLGSAKSALVTAIEKWFKGLKQKAVLSITEKLNP